MMRKQLMRMIRGDWITTQSIGLILLSAAVLIGIAGYRSVHAGTFDLGNFLADYYANASTELTSIAITVLLIDTLNRRREAHVSRLHELEQLTRQLGSGVNEVAKHAAEELRAEGWLTDGTMQESDLRVANLEDAKLWEADLQGVNLQWARLKRANLNRTVLVGANLMQANLQAAKLAGADLRQANLVEAKLYRVNFHGAQLNHADLTGAHLEGARFEDADLSDAILTNAMLDELTTLPDGAKWASGVDLTRFTDPKHPNFWRLTTVEPFVLDNEDEGDE